MLNNTPSSSVLSTTVTNSLLTSTSPLQTAISPDLSLGRSSASDKHVLLLSIDGLREADLTDPNLQADIPNILALEEAGVTYTDASTSSPSDSFPGLLSYLTGAGPATTGVYYDDSYDRTLIAPGGKIGDPLGTEVQLAENIDKNPDLLSGGGDFGVGSIDVSKLPLDANGNPVFPHSYVNVNNIFDVAKAAGLYTAYSDKHPGGYDIVNGLSGNAVNDYYSPEVNAKVAIDPKTGKLIDASNNPDHLPLAVTTTSPVLTAAYDDLKVQAILNEINGLNSRGTTQTQVPNLFGMNFQAVSVGQKVLSGGIAADGTPSTDLEAALKHTDQSIGEIVNALKQNNLFDSTLIVLTAKHGQNPRIGSATLVKDDTLTNALEGFGIQVAQATQDDVALLWLKDPNQTQEAADVLNLLKQDNNPGIDTVFYGNSLQQAGFGTPGDARTPDLIVKLDPGVVLVGNPAKPSKQAEHGGFSPDDLNVGLILGGGLVPLDNRGEINADSVNTTQIAVTTLNALGLDPNQLQGAISENTQPLPGIDFAQRSDNGLTAVFSPGNLVVSRSAYEGTADTVRIGQALPGSTKPAISDGRYPGVFTNANVDPSFGITSPIFLDQIAPDGTKVSTLAIDPSIATTSFPSKSELALNLTPNGTGLTFIAYDAPVNAFDVSNSNTPDIIEPGNPVTTDPTYREVVQVNADGSVQTTLTNAYPGNNGRAVILGPNGFYYAAGNAGNGDGSLEVGAAAGIQIVIPGQDATPDTPGTTQVGTFNITQYGYPADKSAKDNNFRGETIFNNTLYVTKGSGSNGINTVYQVGDPGTLPDLANAANTPITILPGFNTKLAKDPTNTSFPFGIWFADANTLYVADEGDGVATDAAKSTTAGLQKWSLVNGIWKLDYVLQNGLNLGVAYSVPGLNPTLNPATDGLRNLTGKVNRDGTVTLYAVTSTVSANGDQGADPNKLVAITDVLGNTTAAQAVGEHFDVIDEAGFGEVLRGVAFAPHTSTTEG